MEDPLVDKIIFTGSTPIGRKVMESAAHHLKPVILELKGQPPLINSRRQLFVLARTHPLHPAALPPMTTWQGGSWTGAIDCPSKFQFVNLPCVLSSSVAEVVEIDL